MIGVAVVVAGAVTLAGAGAFFTNFEDLAGAGSGAGVLSFAAAELYFLKGSALVAAAAPFLAGAV